MSLGQNHLWNTKVHIVVCFTQPGCEVTGVSKIKNTMNHLQRWFSVNKMLRTILKKKWKLTINIVKIVCSRYFYFSYQPLTDHFAAAAMSSSSLFTIIILIIITTIYYYYYSTRFLGVNYSTVLAENNPNFKIWNLLSTLFARRPIIVCLYAV